MCLVSLFQSHFIDVRKVGFSLTLPPEQGVNFARIVDQLQVFGELPSCAVFIPCILASVTLVESLPEEPHQVLIKNLNLLSWTHQSLQLPALCFLTSGDFSLSLDTIQLQLPQLGPKRLHTVLVWVHHRHCAVVQLSSR